MSKTIHAAELAVTTEQRFRQIVADARALDEIAAEVARTCQEQTNGVRQISTSLVHLDNQTQSAAAKSHESADAARSLDGQAGRLTRLADDLSALTEAAKSSQAMADAAKSPEISERIVREEESPAPNHDGVAKPASATSPSA
jgi:hypothetical protein